MLHLGAISLLPDMFKTLQYGVVGKAIAAGLAHIECWNPRDWAKPPHRQVDDKPYGGGPGMVMMYEPLHQAIMHALSQMGTSCKTIYVSPQGKLVRQAELVALAQNKQPLLFVCGRYEGIDERIIEHHVDEEWSLGNFVLSGGELAAMAFMDALIRLVPGCLGHHESAQQDSFMQGVLDYPHYTRPAMLAKASVPEVLLSGNHCEIERWRKKQALGKTWLKRPELLNEINLSPEEAKLLDEFKKENTSW